MALPIVALLTDFGQRDPFVGTMKGVMLGINPHLQFVDISHEIAPRQIREAAFTLVCSYQYFPAQTIFLVVVDPGVGGTRRPIVAETANHLFVAPDNGVLGPVLSQNDVRRVIHATESAYFRPSISRTFHGRDVFAPLAAWLSSGVSLAGIGAEIHDYARLELPRPRVSPEQTVEGEVIHLDRFGNLITNISESCLAELWAPANYQGLQTVVGSAVIEGIDAYYAARSPGTLGVIINSWELCEIFANGGNAARQTGAAIGNLVRIRRHSVPSGEGSEAMASTCR
jgi:S-adenosylmethionine hydrolase